MNTHFNLKKSRYVKRIREYDFLIELKIVQFIKMNKYSFSNTI